jgi:apolipoprotein N-acyltransferase
MIRTALLFLGSGALGALAFPPVGLDLLIFVALAPFFVAAAGRPRFRVAFLFGVGWFGVGLSWLIPLTLWEYLPLVAVLSLYTAGAASAVGALWGRGPRALFPFAAALAWTGADFFRGWFLGGFPWLYAGHALAGRPALLQTADLCGATGLDFLVALVNAALAHLWLRRGRGGLREAAPALVAAAALGAAALAYGRTRLAERTPADGPSLTAVQPNIAQSLKDDVGHGPSNLRLLAQLTHEAVLDGSAGDLLVWPETAHPARYRVEDPDHPPFDELRQVVAERWKRPMLFGVVAREARGLRNSAVLLDARGARRGVYHKVRLVQFAEYLPGRGWFPPSDWAAALIDRFFGFDPELVPGEEVAPLRWQDDAPPLAASICYDTAFAAITREAAARGARFLVNLSNEGWYGSAELDQMVDLCRFRAVEVRRGMFRCVNTGISCYIDPWGDVAGRLLVGGRDRDVAGTFTARVHVRSETTPFGRLGDPLGWLAMGWFAAWTLGRWLARRLLRRPANAGPPAKPGSY